MKHVKKNFNLNRRILSALLAAAMLLALLGGCAPDPDSASQESGAPAAEPTATPTTESGGGDAALPVGVREPENMEISDEELDDIRTNVELMEESYHYNADENVTVSSRDWTVYSSPLGKVGLTDKEAEFYDRLAELGERYISTDALNGIEHEFSSGTWYLSDRVLYGDLGLVKEQAQRLVRWFLYNNPQYYFFTGATSSSSYYTSLAMYEFVEKGADRAKVTNELFEKLDGWIQQVDSQAANTYQKELLTNNLLCLENVYEFGDYDQSLYSAVMEGKTVCAGFAKAFCAMMNALDVDATVGLSRNEEENMGHAWNVVEFDNGNYYCVDVCWNNEDGSSTGYSNDYLNVGEADSKNSDFAVIYHTYQTGYENYIPAIAADSYIPTAGDLNTQKPAATATPAPVRPSTPSSINLDSGSYQAGGASGGQGDVMNTYWFNFAVDDAYTCASYGDYTPAAGKQMLVVHIMMKNTYSDTLPMFNTDFPIRWEDSASDAYAWPISTNEGEQLWKNEIHIDSLLSIDQLPAEYELESGSTADGVLIYEVPIKLPDGTSNSNFHLSFTEYFSNDKEGDTYVVSFTPRAAVDLSTGSYQAGGASGGQGDVLNTYWFNFAVDGAYTCASYGGYTPAAGNKLLVVHILMKNTYSKDVTMFSTDFPLRWLDSANDAYAWPLTTVAQEELWKNEIHIDSLLSNDQLPAEYVLGVNTMKEGVLIYEVPAKLPDGTSNSSFTLSFREYFANDREGDDYSIKFIPTAR